MRKHNQIHTLGAPHYKVHVRFLWKSKDFKCAIWSEKYGNCWVRVTSSTWNVLWSWNTNKGRPQKQDQKATSKFVDNLIE